MGVHRAFYDRNVRDPDSVYGGFRNWGYLMGVPIIKEPSTLNLKP